MPLLDRVSVLAAKIETTIGTAISLAGADATFNVYGAKIVADIEAEEREGQGGFDYLSSVAAGRKGRITFRTNLQWDGTATEPSWAETFLPACGWVKSAQVYTPRSEAPGSNVKTLTIGKYVNGTLFQLVGCMGTGKVTLPAGKTGYIDWEFFGVWAGRTDATILAPTYPTDLNLRWSGGVSQWNDVDMYASTATIYLGNTVYVREFAGTSSGYHSAIVTTRKPMVTIDPEAVTVAAQDRWGKWLDYSEHALELHCNGPTNSMLQFDAPKAQIVGLSEGVRERLVTDDIEFQCNKNGATHDESLKITFTAAA